MTAYGKAITLLLAGMAGLGTATLADPVPRPPGITEAGTYNTRWGRAVFRIEHSRTDRTRPPEGIMQFGTPGAAIFGALRSGGDWEGRWVHPDARHSGARDCGGPPSFSNGLVSGALRSRYWGRFAGRISGDDMNLSWSSCDDPVRFNPANSNRIWGSLTERARNRSADGPIITVPPPSPSLGLRDGNCDSFLATSFHAINPCYFERPGRLSIRLRRSTVGYIDALIFTPANRSNVLVLDAIARGGAIPRDDAADVPVFIEGRDFRNNNDMVTISLPYTMCSHDFWSIKIREVGGPLHQEQGVIRMGCGPSRLPDPRKS